MQVSRRVERRVTKTGLGFLALSTLIVLGLVVVLLFWERPREVPVRAVQALPVRIVLVVLLTAWWLALPLPRISRYVFNVLREHLRIPSVSALYMFLLYVCLILIPTAFFILLQHLAAGEFAALVISVAVLAGLTADTGRYLDLEIRRFPEDAMRQQLHETGTYDESFLAAIEDQLSKTTDPLERWVRMRRLKKLQRDLKDEHVGPGGSAAEAARSDVSVAHFERKTAERRAEQSYKRVDLEGDVEDAKLQTELSRQKAEQTRLDASARSAEISGGERELGEVAADLVRRAKKMGFTADITMQLGRAELEMMGVTDPDIRERFLEILEALVDEHLRE